MNKIVCAALLTAVSMQAQTRSQSQTTTPPAQVAPPDRAQPEKPRVVRAEGVTSDAARKKLQELGYFDGGQVSVAPRTLATSCAIPLLKIPVPDDRATRLRMCRRIHRSIRNLS
jgi:hypothetical protein